MPSLDLSADYNKLKEKVSATKSYTDLKKKYDEQVKKAGDSFEEKKQDVSEQIDALEKKFDDIKDSAKRYQKELKNQFEQMLDINNVTGGKGSNSIKYIKKTFLAKTLYTPYGYFITSIKTISLYSIPYY